MNDAIDLNAGKILDNNETIAAVGERLYDMIMCVANGEETKAERLGQIQFGIWRSTTEL